MSRTDQQDYTKLKCLKYLVGQDLVVPKAGGLGVPSQPWLHSTLKFCIVRPCLNSYHQQLIGAVFFTADDRRRCEVCWALLTINSIIQKCVWNENIVAHNFQKSGPAFKAPFSLLPNFKVCALTHLEVLCGPSCSSPSCLDFSFCFCLVWFF